MLNAPYMRASREAASLERNEQYEKAARAWHKAGYATQKPSQIIWCKSREQHCWKMAGSTVVVQI